MIDTSFFVIHNICLFISIATKLERCVCYQKKSNQDVRKRVKLCHAVVKNKTKLFIEIVLQFQIRLLSKGIMQWPNIYRRFAS